LTCLACSAQEPPAATPASDKTSDIVSYGIGMQIGGRLKADGAEVNLELLVAGLRDALAGGESRYTDAQLDAAFAAYSREMQAREQARAMTLGADALKAGKAFLAANAAKPGVTTLPSGLQYTVLRPGQGASPKATDTVRVHYEGTLIDGKVFDSSVQRGEPATFPVNRVIPGWTEALQKMKVGDKWQLVIPAELAYGERGAGQDIPPNSVLVFEVELLGIVNGN
jgi:FKBP-type peptidyl-prolyl cis-trans isomerase FklB